MPTFQQLYRLLSTYKLLKPPKFGNCSVNEAEAITSAIRLEQWWSNGGDEGDISSHDHFVIMYYF